MTSEVGICNLALSLLGDEATVTNINPPEGSAQAEHCAMFYPAARDAMLELHDWRFASKRAVLASVTNPLTSWQFAYALPNGCISPRVVLLPGSTNDDLAQDFMVEAADDGKPVLYTNAAQASLRFTSLVTDTTKFTPLMVLALARLLASYLAGPILKGKEGRTETQAQLKIFYQVELPNAAASDANARKSNPYETFTPGGITARA